MVGVGDSEAYAAALAQAPRYREEGDAEMRRLRTVPLRDTFAIGGLEGAARPRVPP
jgi:hypothetical protein